MTTTAVTFTSIRAEDKFDNASASIPINNALAVALGVEAAAIIQQLHYWLIKPCAGWLLRDGTKWLLNGYKEWSKQIQWLKPRQFGKIIRWLEKQKLITTSTLDKLLKIGFVLGEGQELIYHPNNRRKWYGRLNYEELALLTNGVWNPLGLDLKKLKPNQDANVTNSDVAVDPPAIKQCHSECQSLYIEHQIFTKNHSQVNERKKAKQRDEGSSPSSVEILPVEILPVEIPPVEIPNEQNSSASLSNLNKDKYSAADTSKYIKLDYSLQGFHSQEERDGFYQALLELGKHKSGVRSTAGWASAIIKGINAGEPCEYLNEYRRGEPVGTCEKHEWEIAPGRPYDNFVSYLKRKMEANHMSAEQAVEAVFKALRDVNEARTLWEGYKRAIANLKDEWDKQEALGVSNPYIPAEMLPDREVSLSEVTEAIQQLQHSSMQPKTLEPSSTKLLPTEEKLVTESTDEPQENAGAQKEETSERQTRLKAQIERMRQRLKSGTPVLVTVAKNWIKSHSDIVALVDGDIVELMPPDP